MKKSVITLIVIAIVIIAIVATPLYVRLRQKPPAPTSPQVLAIESTGLLEFSPGLVEIETTTPADRAKYETWIYIAQSRLSRNIERYKQDGTANFIGRLKEPNRYGCEHLRHAG